MRTESLWCPNCGQVQIGEIEYYNSEDPPDVEIDSEYEDNETEGGDFLCHSCFEVYEEEKIKEKGWEGE